MEWLGTPRALVNYRWQVPRHLSPPRAVCPVLTPTGLFLSLSPRAIVCAPTPNTEPRDQSVRFLAVIVAALLDYHYPSAWRLRLQAKALSMVERMRALLLDRYAPPSLVWIAAVAAAGLFTLFLSAALALASKVLSWAFTIVVLYVVTDFGATLSRLKRIYVALRRGDTDVDPAHAPTAIPAAEGTAEQATAGAALLRALTRAHQTGFAPLLWFLLLGPASAAAYWMGASLAQRWAKDETLHAAAQKGFQWIDWLPQRFTALTFAVVGDFEDALLCWRTQSGIEGIPSALAVAAGAGASGVRLSIGGGELGLGEPPDADALEGAEAMLWRAGLLWLGVVLLLGAAESIG